MSAERGNLSCKVTQPESLEQVIVQLHMQQQVLAQLRASHETIMRAIAHDLRAPLRHLISFAPLLEESVQEVVAAAASSDAAMDALEFAQTMAASSRKLAGMLDGLLKLSQLSRQPVHLSEVHVPSWMAALVQALPETASAKIRLSVDPAVQVLQVDAVLLQMVLQEGLRNADQATQSSLQPCIELCVAMSGTDEVTMSIVDNGIGASADIAQRLGSPFLKLHAERDFAGVGMGLALAYTAAQKMGAALSIQSQPACGLHYQIVIKPMVASMCG